MGKYVIESKFKNTRCFLEVACENSEPYFFINRIDSLTPYTEPDMEKIREEAYEKGRKVGIKDGMCEAWEVARKVVGLETVDRRKVFGSEYMYSILEKHTASEAIEKIRQYEQEKEEIIDPDKNKVEALANDIGIHKLFALVKEIRGE